VAYFSNAGGQYAALDQPGVQQGSWEYFTSGFLINQTVQPPLTPATVLAQGQWWIVFNFTTALSWNAQANVSQNATNPIQIAEWKASTSNNSSWTPASSGLPYLLIQGCTNSFTPTPSATLTPSGAPTTLPSASNAPTVVALTTNVTANFGKDQPVVGLSAPSSSGQFSPYLIPPCITITSQAELVCLGGASSVGMQSELSQVQVGNATISGSLCFCLIQETMSTVP
jgi:hypothetical protein